MYERDPYNRDNEEAPLFIPVAAKGPAYGADKYRSRLTRDGNTSLEIEIPRCGVTLVERCMTFFLIIFLCVFMFASIAIGAVEFHLSGFGVLGYLFIVVPLLIIVGIPFTAKNWAFTHTYLKITRNEYFMITRNVTWESFIQIMCFPSHFDDLETGRIVETDPKETRHSRMPFLEAKLEPSADKDSSRWIRLGRMDFAHGVLKEELGWLVVEINRFLVDTQ